VIVLDGAIGLLDRINRLFLWIARQGVIGIVALLAIMLSCAVFWRYVLGSAISWSEESAKYLMVWLTFLGAPIALREGAHISIDFLVELLKGRANQALQLVLNILIIATVGIIFWYGWGFAQSGLRQVASTFDLSMVFMYAAIPVGSALMVLVSVEQMLRALRGLIDPTQGITADHHASWRHDIRE